VPRDPAELRRNATRVGETQADVSRLLISYPVKLELG
jgi:hypothetical protein